MIHLEDLRVATNGDLLGEVVADTFDDFCYDSRLVQPGQLFVAVKTGTGDGHQYIREAISGGAGGILCQEPPTDIRGVTTLIVEDTVMALGKWAAHILKRYNPIVIGVAGSVGKSSTKEALATVLDMRYKVYKSPASFNGRYGLPLGLSQLQPEHDIAVLELACDHFGEMAELLAITSPKVGVVTNITPTHIESLGTVENLLREKQQIVEALPEDGIAILNFDDDRVRQMRHRIRAGVFTYGQDIGGHGFGADLLAYNIQLSLEGTHFDLRHEDRRFADNYIPLLGRPHLYAALAALTVGLFFDIPLKEGLDRLTNLQSLPGRLTLLDGINGTKTIDDSFGATPASALAALDFLGELDIKNGRRIFVMGDMTELGVLSEEAHQQIGERAAEVSDLLVTRGELAASAGRAARRVGFSTKRSHIVYSHSDAVECVHTFARSGDVILVTGSPLGRMELVVKQLLAHPEDASRLPRQAVSFDQVRLERPPRPTWIELDLEATAYNVRRIKALVGPGVTVMAVVKANAYGHGAIQISTTATNNGAEWLGVASLNEALELREAGIDVPILILGYTPSWGARQALINDIAVTLYDLDVARMFARAARELRRLAVVHIKVDSGMGRLGLLPHQALSFVREAAMMDGLSLDGIFTHFSVADDPNQDAWTDKQLERFKCTLDALGEEGFHFRHIHAANSAAILTRPDSYFNMVRLGIAMHGLHPSADVPCPPDFRRTLTWKTAVAQVKTLPPGSFVSYGNTYQTESEERVAVIPVGYADGFRRSPEHWGDVLVHGKRASIIGSVTMDQTIIQVSDIPDVTVADEVVLLGRQNNEEITVEEIAHRFGAINYEVVSAIPRRVPRIM